MATSILNHIGQIEDDVAISISQVNATLNAVGSSECIDDLPDYTLQTVLFFITQELDRTAKSVAKRTAKLRKKELLILDHEKIYGKKLNSSD